MEKQIEHKHWEAFKHTMRERVATPTALVGYSLWTTLDAGAIYVMKDVIPNIKTCAGQLCPSYTAEPGGQLVLDSLLFGLLVATNGAALRARLGKKIKNVDVGIGMASVFVNALAAGADYMLLNGLEKIPSIIQKDPITGTVLGIGGVAAVVATTASAGYWNKKAVLED